MHEINILPRLKLLSAMYCKHPRSEMNIQDLEGLKLPEQCVRPSNFDSSQDAQGRWLVL
jgi:hypothetical protein